MGNSYKLCDHCTNRDISGKNFCSNCKNREIIHGRQAVINALKERGMIKDSAKLTNIVYASEIVLFKDLCKVKNVPFSVANKVTTTTALENALNEHASKEELKKLFDTYLNQSEVTMLLPVIEEIDFVYNMCGTVYNSSIHASGALLSEDDISLPIEENTGAVHVNGHYAEEFGYIKFDLLSLSTLDVIVEILGMNVDWNNIETPELMKFIHDNNLTFVFQFGSSIVDKMIKGIPLEKLNTISLSEITSINRPGCLKIGMPEKWTNLQNGVINMKDEADAIINALCKI